MTNREYRDLDSMTMTLWLQDIIYLEERDEFFDRLKKLYKTDNGIDFCDTQSGKKEII